MGESRVLDQGGGGPPTQAEREARERVSKAETENPAAPASTRGEGDGFALKFVVLESELVRRTRFRT
jgi:hypothetical protein